MNEEQEAGMMLVALLIIGASVVGGVAWVLWTLFA